MKIKLSTPGVDAADPNCVECGGNGYRWNGLVCYCVPGAVDEVIICPPPREAKSRETGDA